MGATTFMITATGQTASYAFQSARSEAKHAYGHSGYTGSIAEKRSFTTVDLPKGEDPVKYAHTLLEKDDDRISDKWGPAGCIKLGDDKWLFFGWASE